MCKYSPPLNNVSKRNKMANVPALKDLITCYWYFGEKLEFEINGIQGYPFFNLNHKHKYLLHA